MLFCEDFVALFYLSFFPLYFLKALNDFFQQISSGMTQFLDRPFEGEVTIWAVCGKIVKSSFEIGTRIRLFSCIYIIISIDLFLLN
jgi:hypothetical protein